MKGSVGVLKPSVTMEQGMGVRIGLLTALSKVL